MLLALVLPLGGIFVALRAAKAAAVRIYERAARDVEAEETTAPAGVNGSSGAVIPGLPRR